VGVILEFSNSSRAWAGGRELLANYRYNTTMGAFVSRPIYFFLLFNCPTRGRNWASYYFLHIALPLRDRDKHPIRATTLLDKTAFHRVKQLKPLLLPNVPTSDLLIIPIVTWHVGHRTRIWHQGRLGVGECYTKSLTTLVS
jgi:hypothetical protein